MQYCSLKHWNLLLSPVTSTAGYCFCFGSIPSFFLELFLHWSPVAYWAPTNVGSSSFSILSFLPFHPVHGVLKARILKWFAIPPSPVDHILSDLSTMTHPSWVAPQAWLSFIELDKAVVVVWLDWLVFCDYGFSVSALWCPLATATVLLGFLLPWAWGISSQVIQQSAAAAPYLVLGVSPHHRPSWPSTWDSSSRPYCACAAMAPWTCGWSSWPLPLASGLGLLLSAVSDLWRRVAPLGRPDPDLGCWVAPLGLHPSGMGSSRLLPLTSDVG